MSCKPGGKPTKPLYPSTIKFPGLAQTQIPLRPRDRSQSVGRGRWVALHATDTRKRDKQRQKRDRAVCEEKNAPRVVYGVCGEAGLCEVARRRRLQPQPHGGLAARRAANAGEDVVGTPLGLKAGDVEASRLPATSCGEPGAVRTRDAGDVGRGPRPLGADDAAEVPYKGLRHIGRRELRGPSLPAVAQTPNRRQCGDAEGMPEGGALGGL